MQHQGKRKTDQTHWEHPHTNTCIMRDKKNNTQPRRKPRRKGRRKGGRQKKERERKKRSDSERKTQRRGHHHVPRKRGREEKSKRVSDKNNYRPWPPTPRTQVG